MKPDFKKRSYGMYATAKKRGAADFTLAELREELAQKLNKHPLCYYCHTTLTLANVSLDHMWPISRGGKNGLINIDFICGGCNKAKGDLNIVEFDGLLAALTKLEREHANPNIRKRVIDALKISASFRFGAQRRAKKV